MTRATVNLALAPLGAGDLIDRTVRLYRRHFATLVRMSMPPVVISATGGVLWTVGFRSVAVTDSSTLFVVYVALAAVGLLLQFGGVVLYVVVMGGATRNLVAHLLSGEPVTVRTVYRSVRERFWRLVGATLVVGAWLGFVMCVVLFGWLMVIGVMTMIIGLFNLGLALPSWMLGIGVFLISLLGGAGALWAFVYFGGLLAYVLQAMMVEGRGVFQSISRSMTLARGHLRRLAAMFFFTTCASYSAWLLLVTPLLYIGVVEGLNLNPFAAEETPIWYQIGFQVLWQASSILLAPVWMLGLSLLYIDERVRQEGFDIELAAARVFGDIPALPTGTAMPLAPALARRPVPATLVAVDNSRSSETHS